MRLYTGSIFALATILLLTGCKSTAPYTVDTEPYPYEVNFVDEIDNGADPIEKQETLYFPPSEAKKAMTVLKDFIKWKKNEYIYQIRVFEDCIRVETIIETEKEREERLKRFDTMPCDTQYKQMDGYEFTMRKRDDGKWFVTGEASFSRSQNPYNGPFERAKNKPLDPYSRELKLHWTLPKSYEESKNMKGGMIDYIVEQEIKGTKYSASIGALTSTEDGKFLELRVFIEDEDSSDNGSLSGLTISPNCLPPLKELKKKKNEIISYKNNKITFNLGGEKYIYHFKAKE